MPKSRNNSVILITFQMWSDDNEEDLIIFAKQMEQLLKENNEKLPENVCDNNFMSKGIDSYVDIKDDINKTNSLLTQSDSPNQVNTTEDVNKQQ